MGRTMVTATLSGQKATKEYEFMIDTGSTYMGLPEEEIEELGITRIPQGRVEVRTATGIVEYDTYFALGVIEGRGFGATLLPAPVPLIGYEILENLGMKVNPVSGTLEPVSGDEPHPPFML